LIRKQSAESDEKKTDLNSNIGAKFVNNTYISSDKGKTSILIFNSVYFYSI